MPSTKLHELSKLGQSIWLDDIRRSFLTSGALQAYVDKGLRGLTSNPSIFANAISSSMDYDQDIRMLAKEIDSVEEIYEALAIQDIRLAADILRPVYDQTEGTDGYVSLEVNPHLADETEASVKEAHRLFKAVGRPNLMIKIPATAHALPAVEMLTREGININVTLMFSLAQYDDVAEAYMAGLENRIEAGHDIRNIASVASFFVSRVDVKLDPILEDIGTPAAKEILGTIGIANAKMVYQRFKETFAGERWARLTGQGARLQRVLYGSTSTKNPAYLDTLYADNLIGPNTVNTLPPSALEAFLDHGTVAPTLERDLDVARAQLDALAGLGIDLGAITRQLLDEGVEQFARPFDSLLERIAQKRQALAQGG